jgi:hypothetical protein
MSKPSDSVGCLCKGKELSISRFGKKVKVSKKYTKNFVTYSMRRTRLKGLRRIAISKNLRRT